MCICNLPFLRWVTNLRQDRSFSLSFEEDASLKIEQWGSTFEGSHPRGSCRHHNVDVLKHLTHLQSKAEAQPGLLELPMILLDRWTQEKTKKTDGRRRRHGRKKSTRRSTLTHPTAKMQKQERPSARRTTTPRANHNRNNDNSSLRINTQGTGYPMRRTESE